MSATRKTVSALGLLDDVRLLGPALDPNATVTGVTADSRETTRGGLFVGLKGERLDGAEFVQYAARMGAMAALVSEQGAKTAERDMGGLPITLIVADDPRRKLAQIAARWFGAQPETVVAITGTSGKTSTAEFTRQIWAALGLRAGSLGTLGVRGPDGDTPLGHTTPDPMVLHAALARLALGGVTHAALEASSHGVDQRRLDGVTLKAAAFLNLGRDHMDYHPTVDDYAAAKRRLFDTLLSADAVAVLCADDPWFDSFAAVCAARGIRVCPVGRAAGPDGIRLLDSDYHSDGQTARFAFGGRDYAARMGLIGDFQAQNALTAAALCIACGAEPDAVFAALGGLQGVPGRMEHAATRANGAQIYVDYSHKPDALAAALRALRPHTEGRLHVVFGAGGDRDKGKRPLMGAAAAANADVVIVTDDNPRSEDPDDIRRAIMAGCPEAEEIGGRDLAIITAVDGLEAGDVLMIAGKGHETGQIFADHTAPFDDREQARAAVAMLDADGDGMRAYLEDDE